MRKSIITLSIAAVISFGTVFGGIPSQTKAESVSKLKGDQSKIQDQRSDVNADIKQANDKIGNLQEQQANVKDDMKRLDYAINDAQKNINDKTKKIETTKAEITKLQDETEVIKERIKKRNVLLKDRARSYQENGGMVNYLDVLMGSKSFSDFIDRASAVATIMQADQDILKQHEADKKELEDKQAKIENELASMQKMVADLEKLNQQLNAQLAEKDKLLGDLEVKEQEEHDHVMGLKEKEQALAAQERSIQQLIKQEQERQAAASKPSSNSSGGGGAASSIPVSSGSFTRPTVGTVTSGYGYRDFDHSFHNGVDFGKVSNSDAIVAAADGVVFRSYYSSSYGECVMISSMVNGQLYTTVYAHMVRGSRLVSEGATVKKGQRIGIKGATGDAAGIHLHFELHKGKWEADKRNKIDPAGIVPGI